MINVVGIKFLDGNRIYYFSPQNIELKLNDYVIVETEQGLQIGIVAKEVEEKKEKNLYLPLKNVIRKASKEDLKINDKNIRDSKKALEYAKKIVLDEKIDMKLYDASFTFDKKKLVYKFIADERVDFRELAKILASKYKTRIELRQIGVRDKAKEIGGLGPCGMSLCCSTFLTTFDSVSINMAKNQGISLNPNKINGSCGRLLCCLEYEDELYSKNKKDLPKIGEMISYKDKKGRVIELNVLQKKYKFITNEDEEIEVFIK